MALPGLWVALFSYKKFFQKGIDTYIPRDMMYTVKRGILWMLN